jgi:hypothetical protein
VEAIVTIQNIIKEAIVKAPIFEAAFSYSLAIEGARRRIREHIGNKTLTREEEMKYSRIISTSNTAEGYNSRRKINIIIPPFQ